MGPQQRIGALIGLFVPCQTPALRSILSKLVGEDERGGLFAVQSVAMSLGGLAYPLISTIYMDTLNIYPAAIYLVMVGVMIIALALTLATHLKLINRKGKCS